MRFLQSKNKRAGLFWATLRFGASLHYALARTSQPIQSLTLMPIRSTQHQINIIYNQQNIK